ncbi:MAG TPA: hypothetical protein VM241_04115 [Candidatus Thermoplasmatota archaeon]|nr:hypothetical protein [Candidatus Thermoplasmatota archaeon]
MKRITLQTLGQVGITVLLVMELVSGGGIFPPAAAPAERGVDLGRQAWAGGGPSILFADDMGDLTAHLYDSLDPYRTHHSFDYYGGAVPAADGSVARQWQASRWRYEPLRWGQEGAQNVEEWLPVSAWERTPEFGGAWHFGAGTTNDSVYPTGTLAGIITPVVDLRSVPVLPGAQTLHVEETTLGHQRETPLRAGSTTLGPSPDATVRSAGQTVGDATPVAGITANGAGIDGRADPTPLEATAALRLLHGYQFRVDADGTLLDGGRVEVSQLNPLTGWSAWTGLAPTSATLRLDGRPEARHDVPGATDTSVGAAADPGDPAADPSSLVVELKGQSSATGWVEARNGDSSPVPTVRNGTTVAHPWLYQGPVGTNSNSNDPLNGPWEGFGASSQGPVESVFDLTPYAGQVVRFRFLASSTPLQTSPTISGLGWALDQMEVDAVSTEAVGILDLALPGDGSILPPGQPFAPTVALQNHGLTPVNVAVSLSIDGAIPVVQDVMLGAGPAGRGVAAFPNPVSPAVGLHILNVTLASTPIASPPDLPPAVGLRKVSPVLAGSVPGGPALFHFEVGAGTAWHAVALRTRQVGEGLDPDSRVVLRGQRLQILADLENLGPSPLALSLVETVRPVVRDIHGNSVGEVRPVGEDSILLPVSREIAGPLGAPDAVRTAVWEWSGSTTAQPVVLVLERLGEAPAIELEGGRIRVESIEPPALAVDFSNPWSYSKGCGRHAVADEHAGVIQCAPGGHARSPVQPVTALQLRRGNQAALTVTHKGAAGTILLYRLTGDPLMAKAPPVGSPDWPQTAAFAATLPAAADWANDRLALPAFEGTPTTPWAGWVYLDVAGNGGNVSVDDLRLEAGPQGQGIPIIDETLDADLQPEVNVVRSPTGRPMVRLTGIAVRGGGVIPDATVPSDDPLTYVRTEDGVVTSRDFGRSDVPAANTNDKAHFDTNLSLPGTYHLDGARPTLRFNHWLGADGATGTVEVQPKGALTWTTVAAFAGRPTWTDLQAATVPLRDYVGRTIAIRFHYQLAPELLSPTHVPTGWVLDGVQLDVRAADGTHVLRAPDGFAHYTLPKDVELGLQFNGTPRDRPQVLGPTDNVPGVATPLATWKFDRPGMFFDNVLCATTDLPNTYGISQSAITDPVDLRGMDQNSQPELVLQHGGVMQNQVDGDRTVDNDNNGGTKVFDVEFQTLGPTGWSDWMRATPHALWSPGKEPTYVPAYSMGTWSGAPLDGTHLTDLNGNFVKDPFTLVNVGVAYPAKSSDSPTYTREDNTTHFDLSSQSDAARPGGKIARFRIHAWSEAHQDTTVPGCPKAFAWSVYSMLIHERRQMSDAAVDGISLTPDDGARLGRLDPLLLAANPRAAMVGGDTVAVNVAVRNAGRLALRVNTTLALNVDSPPITYVDTTGPLPVPRRGQRHGVIELEAGKSATVKFLVEFNKLPPGAYALSAVVAPEDAVDTGPANDLVVKPVLVHPFRALAADPAAARVEPAVGTPDALRAVRLLLRNQGNVQEADLRVEADVVRFTSPSDVVPLGLTLPALDPFALNARVGQKTLGWTLDPAALPAGTTFEVGQRYAVRVQVQPQADSFKPWWSAPQAFGPCPATPASPAVPCLPDLTAFRGSCHCILLPFRAEGLLYRNNLDPASSVSALPETFPALGLPQEWEPSLLVEQDGQFVDGTGRADLPQWQVVDGTTAARIGGGPVPGKAWYLPAYPGLETVQHILASPIIPAQVVGPASRALLSLRYASNLTEGQAVLQQRTLQGGRWTPWQPIDSLRNSRAALVLAPDFPRVTGAPFAFNGGYPAGSEHNGTGRPIPPYYTSFTGVDGPQDASGDGKDHPVACLSDVTPTRSCLWSPFPDFAPAGDPEWVAALADSLCALGDTLGPENVELFSTLAGNPALQIPAGTAPTAGAPVVRGPDDTLHVRCAGRPSDVAFQLRELDDLGLHLGDFGAILLVGDGATTTFSGLSKHLQQLSVAPATPAPAGQYASLVQTPTSRPAHPVALQHFAKLFDILDSAGDAGVHVVGSIGPASGALALSGAVQGAQLTTWATPGIPPMDLPDPWMPWVDPVGFATNGVWKCLAFSDPTRSDGYRSVRVNLQPKPACFDSVSGKNPLPVEHALNYEYVSAQDAQSMALQDFLERGGTTFAGRVGIGDASDAGTRHDCPSHPQNHYTKGSFIPAACVVPQPVATSPADDTRLTVVSAARATDAAAWARAVVERMQGTGQLPEGTHKWQLLDPSLGSPVGGRFVRDASGANAFQGAPMQVRLVVTSTPEQGGHGSFLLGPLEVLGTPQEADVGIAFAQPQDGHAYEPGEPGFHPVLELSNRGVTDVPLASLAVRASVVQTANCDTRCAAPPQAPVTLAGLPGTLRAGESLFVTLGNGPPLDQMLGADAVHLPSLRYASRSEGFFAGTFPAGWVPPEPSRFTFTAQLQGAAGPYADDQALDDLQAVQVAGGQVTAPVVRTAADLSWSPTEAARAETSHLVLHATLHNDGSIKRLNVRLRAEVSDARPYNCYRNASDGQSGGFWPCDASDPTHPPLALPLRSIALSATCEGAGKPPVCLVPRGATVERSMALDLDALGLGAGVYAVKVLVDALDPSGTGPPLVHQEFLSIIHLTAPSVPLDQGYARQAADLSQVNTLGAVGEFASSGQCMPDGNAAGLEHGWRVSDDTADPCAAKFGSPGHVLEWRRRFEAAGRKGAQWVAQVNPTTCAQQAPPICDFGPDQMVWQPGLAGQPFNGRPGLAVEPLNGPPTSLAAFTEGQAKLSLDTRFKGTPLTAYVVGIQIPSLVCQPGGSSSPPSCRWDYTGSGTLPLRDQDNATTAGGLNASVRTETCPARGQGGPAPQPIFDCTRQASNTQRGKQALWGADSFTGQPGDDGWRVLQYPIDAVAQPGLADYCKAIGKMDVPVPYTQDGRADPPAGHGVLGACAYAKVQVLRNGAYDMAEIPRPVRFVFTAESTGVEQGQAYWQVRGVSLTEHRLSLAGLKQFTMGLQDGETRRVPLEVRNDALVDDDVLVSIEPIDTGRLNVPHVHMGVTRASTDPVRTDGSQATLHVSVPPGAVRKVWAYVRVDYETNTDAAQVPFFVRFQSERDPTQLLKVPIHASFQALPRANLWAQALLLNQNRQESGSDPSQVFNAAEASPVGLVTQFTNIGLAPMGSPGSPIAVRAVVTEVDPRNGTVLGTEALPPATYTQAVPGCLPSCEASSRFLPLYWTPPHRGLFVATVTLNRPLADDPTLQQPENDFTNNEVSRVINVGAVPMPELQVVAAGLVPYEPGAKECDPDAPHVARALAGHSYCVAARVTNRGGVAALGTSIDFLASGARFSNRQPFAAAGSLFPPQATINVVSSLWDARLRTDGSQDWTFSVELTTASDSLTVLNKTRTFPVHVDLYKLALAPGTAPAALLLAPDGLAYATFNVTNVGTAVASPVAVLAGENATGPLSVHLVQPPPLLPGETKVVQVAVLAGRSFQSGAQLPKVLLSTREDPLVGLALPLTLQMAGNVTARTTLLPAAGTPGPVVAQALLDNGASNVATVWTLTNVSAPLTVADPPSWTVPPFQRRVVDLDITLPPTVPPGAYVAQLGFRVAQGAIAQQATVPLALEVAAKAAFTATLREAEVTSDWSQPAVVRLVLANPGNVPVQARLEATVDTGIVGVDFAGPWHLAPGQSILVPLRVGGGESLRSLGMAKVEWRAEGGEWVPLERAWQASFQPVALRIVQSDLADLRIRAGSETRILATLKNTGSTPVQAEALAVVDGVLHSREPVRLAAGEERQVALHFLAGPAGAPAHVEVLVRPVGSQLSSLEPLFYQVGDMQGRNFIPSPPGMLAGLGVPAPQIPLLLCLLAGAALLAARRRRA